MSKFTVIRDTREKKGHGWWFDESSHCTGTEVKKLDVGDYSIKGREEIVCIERKESVSEIAKKHKGGGHKKAAGFTLPSDFNIEDLFDKVK